MPPRPVRVRQDHRPPRRRRIRAAGRRSRRDRRGRCRARTGPQAQHRHGLPELQPVPQPRRSVQRRLRAAGPACLGHGARSACRRSPRAGPPERDGQALPAPVVWRSATARRPGPCPRRRTGGAAARRAAVGARRQGPRRLARGDPASATPARHDHTVRHARSGGGAVDGGPDRRDVERSARADGNAARGLRRAGEPIRRALRRPHQRASGPGRRQRNRRRRRTHGRATPSSAWRTAATSR